MGWWSMWIYRPENYTVLKHLTGVADFRLKPLIPKQ